MVQNFGSQKSRPRHFASKSFALIVIVLFGCSHKNKSAENLQTYFSKEEGTIHQLTWIGENSEPYFSGINNKILFVRRFGKTNIPAQIFEKNLVDKKEKRLTHNIGDNLNPEYHPFKSWFIYASSSEERAEDHIIYCEVLKKYSSLESQKNQNCETHPFEIYISSDSNAQLKRIIKQKGFDHNPTFAKDGSGFYYVHTSLKNSEVFFFNTNTGKQKIIYSTENKIVDLSVGSSYVGLVEIADSNYTLKLLNSKSHQIAWQYANKKINSLQLNHKNNTALVSGQFSSSQNDIYFLDFDKKCFMRLTHHSADDIQPTFGPAGTTYLFASNRNDTYQIYSAEIMPNLPCSNLE